MADDLTPPGSTVYSSDTMYVGDGTWDKTSNTFLLPNLQSLNFETMRANGMGNRFRLQPQYHSFIQVHGILAAIVFLFLIPFAILFVRFSRRPRWAVRLHIWCQILTVFLTTALFIIPFFAVGPTRSLTNPHHSIGVALYVLILVQFLWGWLVYRREKRRRLPVVPVKTVLHRWLGRLIALLGLAQVPLGLTLYGSPLFLFVLYALVVFALFVAYFVLSFIDERNEGRDHASDTSWASGSGSTVSKRRQSRFGTLAKTAAAGAGIGFIAHKLRNRHEAVGSRRNSDSYVEEEKISEHSHDGGRPSGWKSKLLGAGALGGLGYYAGRMFGRKGDDHSVTSYDYTDSDASRLQEEGMSPNAAHPLNRPLGHRRSTSSMSYSDYASSSPSKQPRNHGVRNAVAGLATFGIARKLFKNRRERKEQKRIDELRAQDIEEERINRANSRRQKYTGDGYPRPGRTNSLTSTNLTPAPIGGPVASGAIVPSMGGLPGNQSAISAAGPPYMTGPTIDGQPLPVVPPPPQAVQHSHHASDSDVFSSPGRRNNLAETAAAGLAGGAAGAAIGNRRNRSSSRRRHSGSTGQMASPPVSVKLNMHSDGRHVTLRRLTEEEAAADRARRAGRSGSKQRPAGSASTMGGSEVGYGGDKWRRAEDRERQEQIAMERQQLQNSQSQLHAGNLAIPGPPPIPGSDIHGPGSVGSPGTYDGTMTEASNATNYDLNRKRRRAERAATAQAKAAKSGGRVEFE